MKKNILMAPQNTSFVLVINRITNEIFGPCSMKTSSQDSFACQNDDIYFILPQAINLKSFHCLVGKIESLLELTDDEQISDSNISTLSENSNATYKAISELIQDHTDELKADINVIDAQDFCEKELPLIVPLDRDYEQCPKNDAATQFRFIDTLIWPNTDDVEIHEIAESITQMGSDYYIQNLVEYLFSLREITRNNAPTNKKSKPYLWLVK